MKTWKKNAIAAAALVTVCSGIYLNWMYTQSREAPELDQAVHSDKLLNDDLLVLSEAAEGPAGTGSPDSTRVSSDYFAAVRLSRQEARDSAVSLLQEAMAYSEGSEVSHSSRQLDELVETALSEAQIESMIIAKGYRDCVAYMNDDGISVAVAAPENGLAQADVAVISDIVMTQSDYELADIRVVEVE